MKIRAQPCLRDYLTIHVPASTLMGDRIKRNRQNDQLMNPLMNKKLQLNNRKSASNLVLTYSNVPNRSYGKNKKLQIIPLLSNIAANKSSKLRIVKDSKKLTYNLIFSKDKQLIKEPQQKQPSRQQRMISTSHSNKSLNRKIFSQATSRQLHQIKKNQGTTLYSNFLQASYVPRVQNKMYQTMEISGFKANLCNSPGYLRKQSELQSCRYYSQQRHSRQLFQIVL